MIMMEVITRMVLLVMPTILWMAAWGSPPEDPIKCMGSSCSVDNAYGAFPDRSKCKAAEVVYPASEEELLWIVGNASMQRRKMRVATRFSHSIPKLVCPEEDGLLISTRNLKRILDVDRERLRMRAESGLSLRELEEAAAEADMALPYAPYWWGLTLGGMLATGSHGSSLWGLGSSIHDYINGLCIVTLCGLEGGGPLDYGDAASSYSKLETLQPHYHADEGTR